LAPVGIDDVTNGSMTIFFKEGWPIPHGKRTGRDSSLLGGVPETMDRERQIEKVALREVDVERHTRAVYGALDRGATLMDGRVGLMGR